MTSDQVVVEPCAAEPGSGGADPAQFCGPSEQLGGHRAVSGIGVGDVVGSVFGIAECFDHDARYRPPDFPKPIEIGCEQQNIETH